MSTLDQLTDELLVLDRLLAETEGEITPEIEEWMQEYGDKVLAKVDNVAFFLVDLDAQATVTDEHAKRLAAKAKTQRRKAEAIRRYVEMQMAKLGVKELKGTIYRFAMQKNGGNAPVEVLVPTEDLPPEFVKTKIERSPDLALVRAALEQGNISPSLARFGERGESLRLR